MTPRSIISGLTRVAFIALVLCAASCSRIDDKRIPSVNVNIVFSTDGMWSKYGVGGALQWKRFIKTSTQRVPADFPFTVSTYTGYGGVLLVGDLYGNPVAYDLSCPYEVKPDIRIEVDDESHDAYCPVCGSTYDIYGGQGRPTSGPSAERGYGLTRYNVLTGSGLNYRVVTR